MPAARRALYSTSFSSLAPPRGPRPLAPQEAGRGDQCELRAIVVGTGKALKNIAYFFEGREPGRARASIRCRYPAILAALYPTLTIPGTPYMYARLRNEPHLARPRHHRGASVVGRRFLAGRDRGAQGADCGHGAADFGRD